MTNNVFYTKKKNTTATTTITTTTTTTKANIKILARAGNKSVTARTAV